MAYQHDSETPLSMADLKAIQQWQEPTPKPIGLWFGVDGAWRETDTYQSSKPPPFRYEVEIDPEHVLFLDGSIEALKAFEAKYSSGKTGRLRWDRVAADYHGIVLTSLPGWKDTGSDPFFSNGRDDFDFSFSPFHTFDCPSGCIWDPVAIKSIKPLIEPKLSPQELFALQKKRTVTPAHYAAEDFAVRYNRLRIEKGDVSGIVPMFEAELKKAIGSAKVAPNLYSVLVGASHVVECSPELAEPCGALVFRAMEDPRFREALGSSRELVSAVKGFFDGVGGAFKEISNARSADDMLKAVDRLSWSEENYKERILENPSRVEESFSFLAAHPEFLRKNLAFILENGVGLEKTLRTPENPLVQAFCRITDKLDPPLSPRDLDGVDRLKAFSLFPQLVETSHVCAALDKRSAAFDSRDLFDLDYLFRFYACSFRADPKAIVKIFEHLPLDKCSRSSLNTLCGTIIQANPESISSLPQKFWDVANLSTLALCDGHPELLKGERLRSAIGALSGSWEQGDRMSVEFGLGALQKIYGKEPSLIPETLQSVVKLANDIGAPDNAEGQFKRLFDVVRTVAPTERLEALQYKNVFAGVDPKNQETKAFLEEQLRGVVQEGRVDNWSRKLKGRIALTFH